MTNLIATTQLGDKKDRTLGILASSRDQSIRKKFIVKGIDKKFFIFENDSRICEFKTRAECIEFISTIDLTN